MKKKIIVQFIAVMICGALALAGCGDDENSQAEEAAAVEEQAAPEADETKELTETDQTLEEAVDEAVDEAEENDDEDDIDNQDEGLVDRRTDVQKYWNGDWYGWLGVLSTGAYEEFNDESYDTCGRIEVDENGDGTLTLWYGYEDGDTYAEPTGVIDIHIDEDMGGSHGTLVSTGGWMFVEDYPEGRIEEGEITTKPDEEYSLDCLYIRYKYEDDNGTISPLFALRPWGYTWEDDSYYEHLDGDMPAFFKWYTRLISEGWAMPDDFESEPTKTIEEREIELIELAADQNTPVRTDSDWDSFFGDDADWDDETDSDSDDYSDNDSYYNDSTDFENDLGSSRITHGFDKEITNPKITGKSYSWGKLSVNIPDGMEAKDGGIANKNDENSVQAVKGTKYFIISQRYELDALEDVSTTVETNDADEITVTVDGTQWEGAYYEYSGTPVWQIYADVDGACIEVMAYGFDFDSAEAQTILATAKSTAPIWE